MLKRFITAVLCTLILSSVLWAGKLTLHDGTVYEGEIKKLGTSYSIKLKDGSLKLISATDIQSIDDPKLSAPGGEKKPDASNMGEGFVRASRAAERSEQPLLAATIWQKYIDDNPAASDLDKARAEQKRWQTMADQGAEKIKGKWVVGDDLKKLHAQVDTLMRDAVQLMSTQQTLKSITKLQEVIRIYPNSFEAHFELGYYYLLKGGNEQYDKAITSLEMASKIRPNSAETLSNLAIAYNFRRKYDVAVLTAYKAVQIQDSPAMVQNLINALSYAPPGMRANHPKVRPIMEESMVLASRHGIGGPSGQWTYVRPRPGAELKDEDGPGPLVKGIIGSGTGFFINDSGYIMTNRHVAGAADQVIVRMSDGTQKLAEKIHVDDKQDIAILRIKTDAPTPFISLAAYDTPPIGTDVTVMGFPLGAAMGANVKITRGVVTAVEDKPECDVIVDAQVNPGNSGGPMIDKYGNVLALVAMKTLSDEAVSSYGLGIGTGRLRKYFDEQKQKLTFTLAPGTKGAPMSTEEIAEKYTKATVMLLMVAGEVPDGLK